MQAHGDPGGARGGRGGRAGAGLSYALRVTFVASAAREILPSILRAFREQYPKVELTLPKR
jgi:DNA-binding transcriptional LysR family regulator